MPGISPDVAGIDNHAVEENSHDGCYNPGDSDYPTDSADRVETTPQVSEVPSSLSPGGTLDETSPAAALTSDAQLPATPPPVEHSQTTSSNTGREKIEHTRPIYLAYYPVRKRSYKLLVIECILRSRFSRDESFQKRLANKPHRVFTDAQFFRELRRLYEAEFRSFWSRLVPFPSPKTFNIITWRPSTVPIMPEVMPLDSSVRQQMMYAYQNPDEFSASDVWVQWMFNLGPKDKRYAVEFVDDWDSSRFAVMAGLFVLSYSTISFILSISGRDGAGKAVILFGQVIYMLVLNRFHPRNRREDERQAIVKSRSLAEAQKIANLEI